ncbi:hypothetical protein BKA65DRAFT_242435 [Rhexocercosporidium sp. MPI-PUGE-AT-0058]|nr:hypothetical protein BKA65DRAFT_242435 [Rhexocercosporidium sp. MPI-PUGE-AT-0058]
MGLQFQEHSSRLFTYQRDRLVSLEALASKFKHFKPPEDFYAFGIWGSDMPLHFLWSPRLLAREIKDQPSWSWVSCPGDIWFRIRDTATRHDCETFTSQCSILGVDLTTGTLKLRAKKMEIQENLMHKFDLEDDRILLRGRANHQTGYYVTASERDAEAFGWAILIDARRGASIFKSWEDQRIFFLYLSDAEFSTPPYSESYGLLLAKATLGKEKFIRIGIAAMSKNTWIKDEPIVVDII